MADVLMPRTNEYRNMHWRIRKARGKASSYLCEGCCGSAARHWARRHDRDGFDVQDYVPLCVSCHHRYDGITSLGRVASPETRALISKNNGTRRPEVRAKMSASGKANWARRKAEQ